MTQDYTALEAELRALHDSIDRRAADAIANLQRERDELRQAVAGQNRQMCSTVTHGQYVEMAQMLHAACDGGRTRAEAAEAERDRLAAKCKDAVTLLHAFLNAEYESKDDLFDCVDNTGKPYQSQWLADRIAETERFLVTGSRAALQEPQT